MVTYQSSEFINGGISHWMQDVTPPKSRPPLSGDSEFDAVIVGGGLTGLWTAYYLKTAAPELNIAILERSFTGFGASGRNGGWLSAELVGSYRRYAQDRGDVAAQRLQHAMFGAVQESVDVARHERFDEDLVHEGLMHVATNPAQLARVEDKVSSMHEQGWGKDDVEFLSADELSQRVNVNGAYGGYWTPHCARIHPAKYTLGLTDTVENLGVKIFESTTANKIGPQQVVTDRGTVSARYVVQALEGYTHTLDGKQRRMLPMNSSMAITEPLSAAQMEAIGWDSAELLGDVAHSFTYMQRTADNRIAIGGRGIPYNFASSYDPRWVTADFAVEQLYTRLLELFPALEGIRFDHTWSGVLGVPRDWSAAVNYDRENGIVTAGGYVGHGVAGTNLAGRAVRDLILNRDTDLTRLPWVSRYSRNWEPEPFRWVGARILYAVYRYADRREDASPKSKTHWTAKVAHRISGRH